MADPPPATIPRRHDLDALRAFAMLLGIALHAGLSFVEFPWVVQDSRQHPLFGLFFLAVHGFRMPLFFVLSGFFTAMLWRSRGLSRLIGHRTRRILLPLLLGLVTVLPATWAAILVAGASRGLEYDPPAKTGRADVWSSAKEGNLESLRQHAEGGTDLNAADITFGHTPLAWAAAGGRPEAVKFLLGKGADPNKRYRDGNTALHTAAFFGRAECAKLLLEAGAEIEPRNDNGEAPVDSLTHDRGTTEFIFGMFQIKCDFAEISSGRERLAAMLKERGAAPPKKDRTSPGIGAVINALIIGLMLVPFFGHLWFLWFLCWLVAGFALVVWFARVVRLPGPPAWLTRTFARWFWIVPLTMLPQFFMHQGGKLPGFGPDTSAGILPMPHVLFYYAVFFAFGVFYYDARDDAGKVGRFWWANLGLGLLIVLPVSLAFSLHAPWTYGFMEKGSHRVVAVFLEVVFTWLLVFGLMGLFRKVLARERYWIRYVSDSSYWLYLAHLPLVIAAQFLVKDWPVPSFIKFSMLLTVTTAFLLLTYRYMVRYTWIGRMLNGRRTPPTPPSPQ